MEYLDRVKGLENQVVLQGRKLKEVDRVLENIDFGELEFVLYYHENGERNMLYENYKELKKLKEMLKE